MTRDVQPGVSSSFSQIAWCWAQWAEGERQTDRLLAYFFLEPATGRVGSFVVLDSHSDQHYCGGPFERFSGSACTRESFFDHVWFLLLRDIRVWFLLLPADWITNSLWHGIHYESTIASESSTFSVSFFSQSKEGTIRVENQQEYWLMCRISSWTHLLLMTFVNTISQTPTTTTQSSSKCHYIFSTFRVKLNTPGIIITVFSMYVCLIVFLSPSYVPSSAAPFHLFQIKISAMDLSLTHTLGTNKTSLSVIPRFLP